jgi:hypothetical protein
MDRLDASYRDVCGAPVATPARLATRYP